MPWAFMGGYDQYRLALGRSCGRVDGLNGILKDGRIQLEEKRKRAARRGESHEPRPGSGNEVVPTEEECKMKNIQEKPQQWHCSREESAHFPPAALLPVT